MKTHEDNNFYKCGNMPTISTLSQTMRRAPTLNINAPHIAILVDLGKGLRVLLGQVLYGLVCIHILLVIGVLVELERVCLRKSLVAAPPLSYKLPPACGLGLEQV